MVKLKKYSLHIAICPTCKGNGYVKVATEESEAIHQCWDCDSEGEFYVHEPETIQPDNSIDPITGDIIKLH